MLKNFTAKNFKNLESLTIDSLARVNLITGKNNTGKSTLLEALLLFLGDMDSRILRSILNDRDQLLPSDGPIDISAYNVDILSSFFPSMISEFSGNMRISFSGNTSQMNNKRTEFFFFYGDSSASGIEQAGIIEVVSENKDEDDDYYEEISNAIDQNDVRFVVDIHGKRNVFSLDNKIFIDRNIRFPENATISFSDTTINLRFVSSNSCKSDSNANDWDEIALVEKKVATIIDALNIIENRIEGLSFKSLRSINGSRRVPFVRLRDSKSIVPLKSMGDGINRILSIILAMVNCENGYLFIDEFENGLHYSVQKDLWNVIFQVAEHLNIQVFATTHSSDAIGSFHAVLSERADKNDGLVIRLENRKGVIRSVPIPEPDLGIVIRNNFEIR